LTVRVKRVIGISVHEECPQLSGDDRGLQKLFARAKGLQLGKGQRYVYG
jgi:hypothetical protein